MNNSLKIRHKIFQKKMMGYDPEEVNQFLKQISQDMEQMVRERNSLAKTLKEKEHLVQDFSKKDEILQKAITNATEMAERIKQEAYKKAQETMESARKKSKMILEESEKEFQRYQKEFLHLKKVKINFEKNFRRLLYNYMKTLDEKPQTFTTPRQVSSPETTSITKKTEVSHRTDESRKKLTQVLESLLKDVKLFKS